MNWEALFFIVSAWNFGQFVIRKVASILHGYLFRLFFFLPTKFIVNHLSFTKLHATQSFCFPSVHQKGTMFGYCCPRGGRHLGSWTVHSRCYRLQRRYRAPLCLLWGQSTSSSSFTQTWLQSQRQEWNRCVKCDRVEINFAKISASLPVLWIET